MTDVFIDFSGKCKGTDECPDEETYHIREDCPYCDFYAEGDARNCVFEECRDVVADAVGDHILELHPGKIFDGLKLMADGFQKMAAAFVDASARLGRLADYGRNIGRTATQVQRDARPLRKACKPDTVGDK
jgi:hypothetical protein